MRANPEMPQTAFQKAYTRLFAAAERKCYLKLVLKFGDKETILGITESAIKRNMLKIQDARREDRDAARKITLSAFQQYAAVMPPPRWEGYRENILATLTEVAPAQQIVAEKEGIIVGSVLLYPPGTTFSIPDQSPLACPEVRLLAVAPEFRGQGIATALMKECIRRARMLGTACLSLHTTDMMQVAMRMYERMGFVRAPDLDFHPDPSVNVKAYRLEFLGPGIVKKEGA
jgi:predicted N-acetyltransferase YhbS